MIQELKEKMAKLNAEISKDGPVAVVSRKQPFQCCEKGVPLESISYIYQKAIDKIRERLTEGK